MLATLVAAASLAGFAAPLRVAFAPMVHAAPYKFAGPDRRQTSQIVSGAVDAFLDKTLTANTIVLIEAGIAAAAIEDLKLDFGKSGHRQRERLQAFGKAAAADFALLVLVEWSDQKNAEIGAIASNPAGAKSSSRVRIRVWLQDVAADRLVLDGGKTSFEGESKGPYFGTVDPRDMSGDPTSKGLVISAEYRKRAGWLGKAAVEALRDALRGPLNLKEMPPVASAR